MQAGEYDFTETLEAGNARINIKNKKTSFLTGKNYTVRVVPKIESISSHVRSFYGSSDKC